jgi:ubiquinone biosynthesis protein COQ9
MAIGSQPSLSTSPAARWDETTEQGLLDAALPLAAGRGWTQGLVLAAAAKLGLSSAEADLLLPHGPADLAALLSRRHDDLTLAALAGTDPASLKMRQRISLGILTRLDIASAEGQALHRWAGYLALPHHLPLALRLVWESADRVWRWAGDTATDENHYSKRALVAGILASAMAVRLSSGAEASNALVAARIDNVMAFETWKAKLKPSDFAKDLASALGKMRYG